jgi:hypothetical protein
MDPVSLAIATAIASKGTEMVVGRGADAWRQLMKIVKDRLARDRGGVELLRESALDELSEDQINRLGTILTVLRQHDPAFDDQVRRAWQAVDLHQESRVHNVMSGTAGGHVVQAGRISGGVRLGRVR